MVYDMKLLQLRGIHKLRHALRGDGGVRRSTTLCDKGGEGILNLVTTHFKNIIKAILQYQSNGYKYIKVINDIKEWIRSPWTQDV